MTNPLAAIHIAKKQLGLDDGDYRALLKRVTGKSSSKNMTDAERQAVLAEMRRRGFKPAPKGSSKGGRSAGGHRSLEGPFAKKVQALWIAGWNLGIVRSRDDKALIAFVKRQTGIDHTNWLVSAADAKRVIEALKGWMAREAGVDWTGYDNPREAVLRAIFKRLVDLGAFKPFAGELNESDIVSWARGAQYCWAWKFGDYSDQDWINVQNRAGAKLRAALAKQRGAA